MSTERENPTHEDEAIEPRRNRKGERGVLQDPWIVTAVAAGALLFAIFLTGGQAAAESQPLAFALYLVFILLAGGRAWGRARRAESSTERRFWGLLTGALGAWLLATSQFLSVPEELYAGVLLGTLLDLVFALYYLGVVLAAEQRPELARRPGPRELDQRLEVLGLLLFAVTLVGYFILVPNLTVPELGKHGETLGGYFLYLSLDLYLVLRFLYLARRSPHAGWAKCYVVLASGHLIFLVTDVVELLTRLPDSSLEIPAWANPFWYLPFLAVPVAARLRERGGEPPASLEGVPTLEEVSPRRLVVFLVVLVLLHLGAGVLGGTGGATYGLQGVLVLLGGLLLGVLAQLQYRNLDRRNRRLLQEREATLQELQRSEEALRERNEELEGFNERLADRVRARTQEVRNTRDVALMTLAGLTEWRDQETGRHLARIAHFSERLARGLAEGAWRLQVGEGFVEEVRRSSPLHDIGKVGIPDAILLKPGPLTPAEMEVMRRHTTIGGDTLRSVIEEEGGEGFLRTAKEIAYSHHERWDGKGYPQGLAGEEIPLAARIVALVDAYDAITSVRPYKLALPHETAVERITADRGRHFDPEVVDVFLACRDELPAMRSALDEAPEAVGG